jgi:hypothetical protein
MFEKPIPQSVLKNLQLYFFFSENINKKHFKMSEYNEMIKN